MKRSFKLTNLGCANCAAKMESVIGKFDGVDNVTINFMSQRLIIEGTDDQFESILDQAQKAITKIERKCKIERPKAV